jgi:oxysterol-binding protein-related protein 8
MTDIIAHSDYSFF